MGFNFFKTSSDTKTCSNTHTPPSVLVGISSGLPGDGLHNLQIQPSEVQDLQHFLGVGIHLDGILLKSGYVWHVVIPPLSLLLLQFDGNPSDGSQLDPLHEMGDATCDLVPQLLAGNDGALLAYAFVHVEVVREAGVVLLDHNLRCLLHCLRSNTAHGLCCWLDRCDLLISVTICSLIFFICPM